MTEVEGVIKYQLDFDHAEPITESIEELNVLRSLMFQMGFVGQEPQRYGGYGFGNLSMRSRGNPDFFIITGTQTGHLPELSLENYTTVTRCDVASNHVVARGLVKPSSEALTHAMFYQQNTAIKCVIHGHSAELWRFGLQNDYPSTDASVSFGTVQMAQEINRLYQSGGFEQRQVLVMEGHEDGVIAFGNSVDEAGMAMLQFYVDAHIQYQ